MGKVVFPVSNLQSDFGHSASLSNRVQQRTTPRPNQMAWNMILEALAKEKTLPELNRLFRTLLDVADRDGLIINDYNRIAVFELNIEHLCHHPALPQEEFDNMVSYLLDRVNNLQYRAGTILYSLRRSHHEYFVAFLSVLVQRSGYADVLQLLKQFVQSGLQFLDTARMYGALDAQMVVSKYTAQWTKSFSSKTRMGCTVLKCSISSFASAQS